MNDSPSKTHITFTTQYPDGTIHRVKHGIFNLEERYDNLSRDEWVRYQIWWMCHEIEKEKSRR